MAAAAVWRHRGIPRRYGRTLLGRHMRSTKRPGGNATPARKHVRPKAGDVRLYAVNAGVRSPMRGSVDDHVQFIPSADTVEVFPCCLPRDPAIEGAFVGIVLLFCVAEVWNVWGKVRARPLRGRASAPSASVILEGEATDCLCVWALPLVPSPLSKTRMCSSRC